MMNPRETPISLLGHPIDPTSRTERGRTLDRDVRTERAQRIQSGDRKLIAEPKRAQPRHTGQRWDRPIVYARVHERKVADRNSLQSAERGVVDLIPVEIQFQEPPMARERACGRNVDLARIDGKRLQIPRMLDQLADAF